VKKNAKVASVSVQLEIKAGRSGCPFRAPRPSPRAATLGLRARVRCARVGLRSGVGGAAWPPAGSFGPCCLLCSLRSRLGRQPPRAPSGRGRRRRRREVPGQAAPKGKAAG
jgi:hypothetical protein